MAAFHQEFTDQSSIEELLRALFRLHVDVIRIERSCREVFFRKEQLIVFIEKGMGRSSLASLPEGVGYSRSDLEHVGLNRMILDLTAKGGWLCRFSELKGRGEDFWSAAAIPLLRFREGGLEFNEAAQERWGTPNLPCDCLSALDEGEEITVLAGDNRHYLVKNLGMGHYLLDDVSVDMATAREIAWWAAVGKALVRRMEENGAVIDSFEADCPESPLDPTRIPCHWEGRLLGYIAVKEVTEAEPS